jgi:hypothetical protein
MSNAKIKQMKNEFQIEPTGYVEVSDEFIIQVDEVYPPYLTNLAGF